MVQSEFSQRLYSSIVSGERRLENFWVEVTQAEDALRLIAASDLISTLEDPGLRTPFTPEEIKARLGQLSPDYILNPTLSLIVLTGNALSHNSELFMGNDGRRIERQAQLVRVAAQLATLRSVIETGE